MAIVLIYHIFATILDRKSDCICPCLFHQCSVTCGVGVQKRDVYCRLKGTGSVREDLCDAHQRPAAARPCQTAECSHYSWVAGEWEEVSRGSYCFFLFLCITPSLPLPQ